MILNIIFCVTAYYVVCCGLASIYDRIEGRIMRRSVARARLGRLALPILAIALLFHRPAAADPAPAIEVHFSPNGGCTAVVTQLISSAHGSVRIAAYSFTSEPITAALIAAHDHGRDVQVLIDHAWAGRPLIGKLQAAGVPVFVDARHPIMHDKFVVIDGVTVETGSFNYTSAAEYGNAENCVVLRDSATAKLFAANWLGHSAHSKGGGR